MAIISSLPHVYYMYYVKSWTQIIICSANLSEHSKSCSAIDLTFKQLIIRIMYVNSNGQIYISYCSDVMADQIVL